MTLHCCQVLGLHCCRAGSSGTQTLFIKSILARDTPRTMHGACALQESRARRGVQIWSGVLGVSMKTHVGSSNWDTQQPGATRAGLERNWPSFIMPKRTNSHSSGVRRIWRIEWPRASSCHPTLYVHLVTWYLFRITERRQRLFCTSHSLTFLKH